MKTFTVLLAATIILLVGGTGPVPFLVLCSVKSEAYGSRFAAAGLLAEASLVAEYVRLNGIFTRNREPTQPADDEGRKS